MTDYPVSEDVERVAALPSPDAHGQAALLLVESLIHGLVSRTVISVADAVEIASAAGEVTQEIIDDQDGEHEAALRSLAMLEAIRKSLSTDLD